MVGIPWAYEDIQRPLNMNKLAKLTHYDAWFK